VHPGQRAYELTAFCRAQPGQRALGDLAHLGVDVLLQLACPFGEIEPDQPPVGRVRLAAQQAGRLHPVGRPGHSRRGQAQLLGDLTGGLTVLPPQAAEHELLPFVHAMPRERRA
jgi:hypothetical protein